MNRKVIATAAALALLAGSVLPVLANGRRSRGGVSVSNNNSAIVLTGAAAVSNTGGNTQNDNASGGGDADGNDYMETGNSSAYAGAVSVVNKNDTRISGSCRCLKKVSVRNSNHAFVATGALAVSNTGGNTQNDNASGGGGHAGQQGGGGGHRGSRGGDAEGDDVMFTGHSTAASGAGSWVNVNYTRVRSN